MMADAEKMFVCSSSGCNMSFTNEDHLTLHKKKHDMILNLGNSSKNGGFVADQTPTPTRFIRNCEEVGLFQDLQNVNPFEETFRRAVESGNTGTLTVPEVGNTDDTLHTPHIFPHMVDVLPTNNQILSESTVQECESISITEKRGEEKSAIDAEICTNVKLTETGEQASLKEKLPVDRNVTVRKLSINGEEVQLLLKTADGKLMQLSAVPVSEPIRTTNVSSLKQQTVVIKTEPPLLCNSRVDSTKPTVPTVSIAKMKLKQSLVRNIGSQNQKGNDNLEKEESNTLKRSKSKTVEEQLRKKDIQERNRASSMRARAKRKAWIQQLERTVANVNETNVALQMEIKVLRAEVAKLKTLLLAHKDCPVTKAMQKGSGILLCPKMIPVNSDVLNGTVPMTTATKRISTFSSTEVPIVPKKKLSFEPTKNPVIFTKIDSSTNLTIPNKTLIKTIPTLKIMNVGQLLTKNEEKKQIFIVQKPPQRVENPPRRIIQINPNYEIEQSASLKNNET